MRKLTRREKVLLVLAAYGLFLMFVMRGVIQPLAQERQQAQESLEALSRNYAKYKRLSESDLQPDKLALPQTRAGEQASMAEFIRKIEAAAGRGVFIRRFRPLKNAQLGRQPGAKTAARGTIIHQQIQIDCTGSLGDLAQFFDRLEKPEGVIRIRNLTLTPARDGQNRLRCQMVIARLVVL